MRIVNSLHMFDSHINYVYLLIYIIYNGIPNQGTKLGLAEFIMELTESIPQSVLGRVAMLLWAFWWRRNNKVWENVDKPPLVVVCRANEVLLDWDVVNKKVSN